MTLLDDPDPRRIKTIEAKLLWLRSEAVSRELNVARAAAMASSDAVLHTAAWNATRAAWSATWNTAYNAVYEAQVAYLIMVLEEEK